MSDLGKLSMLSMQEEPLFNFDEDPYDYDLEASMVGAALGSGYEHSSELKVMKYDEAINMPDKEHWDDAVEMEHKKFKKYYAFEQAPRKKSQKMLKLSHQHGQ